MSIVFYQDIDITISVSRYVCVSADREKEIESKMKFINMPTNLCV